MQTHTNFTEIYKRASGAAGERGAENVSHFLKTHTQAKQPIKVPPCLNLLLSVLPGQAEKPAARSMGHTSYRLRRGTSLQTPSTARWTTGPPGWCRETWKKYLKNEQRTRTKTWQKFSTVHSFLHDNRQSNGPMLGGFLPPSRVTKSGLTVWHVSHSCRRRISEPGPGWSRRYWSRRMSLQR